MAQLIDSDVIKVTTRQTSAMMRNISMAVLRSLFITSIDTSMKMMEDPITAICDRA